MGLDGGTIPSRADIIRGSSWRLVTASNSKSTRGGSVNNLPSTEPSQGTKQEQSKSLWRTCALTGQPLKEPIVACELGKLYNRDSIIEFLMKEGIFVYSQESLKQNGFGHITSLKSVFEVHFVRNDASTHTKSIYTEETTSYTPGLFVCPITQLETNGLHQFCALRTCGHVISEKALNLFAALSACPTCSKPYIADDIITLNGNEKVVADLEKRMQARKEQSGGSEKKRKNSENHKKEKKEKKGKKHRSEKHSQNKDTAGTTTSTTTSYSTTTATSSPYSSTTTSSTTTSK